MELSQSDPKELVEICSKEIDLLHFFFVNWYSGIIEKTSENFLQLEKALSEKFFLITPEGKILNRSEIIELINSNYGKYKGLQGEFEIWIKNPIFRYIKEDVITLTYEEWQKIGYETHGRLSSVAFLHKEGTDTLKNLKWLHVHEVWLN